MGDEENGAAEEVVVVKTVMIAHAEESAERKRMPIDLTLWRAVVDQDPALEVIDHIRGRAYDDEGRLLTRVPRPGSASWSGHPKGMRVTFVPKYGGIVLMTEDPEDSEMDMDGFVTLDEPALAKCNDIAAKLHAKVLVRELEVPVWND